MYNKRIIANQICFNKRIQQKQQFFVSLPSDISPNMRKQQPTQIKLMHKKYHFLNKSDIAIIYDFCQSNLIRTQKILTIAKDIRNPITILKTLLQKPQKGQTLLLSLQRRYDQQYFQQKKQQNTKNDKQQLNTFSFFNYIPKDVLLTICIYLDPYTIINLAKTCKKISKIYTSQTFNQYFKNLCINLFQKCQQKLPNPSRFMQVRNYVYKNSNQFGPNTKNAINNKLRYYVWQYHPVPQKKQKSYLLSFGSYRKLYFKLPRIHFNGLYMCKHQYRKQEQRNLLTNIVQVHYINYFRYFRFMEDGSAISAVFSAKQKLNVVAQMMEARVLDIQAAKLENSLMIGQFIQNGNKIQVKLFKQGAIFTYILQICSSQTNNPNQITDRLIVKHYYLKVVDQKQIIQTLQQYNQKFPMIFKYYYSPIIRKQNSKLIKSSSL